MGFPSAKVHRVSRRKLGRGQSPQRAPTTCTVTNATAVVTVHFSGPVVASQPLTITVATVTILSQRQPTPTTYEFTMSATAASHAYTFDGNQPGLIASNGGSIIGAAGTF